MVCSDGTTTIALPSSRFWAALDYTPKPSELGCYSLYSLTLLVPLCASLLPVALDCLLQLIHRTSLEASYACNMIRRYLSGLSEMLDGRSGIQEMV